MYARLGASHEENLSLPLAPKIQCSETVRLRTGVGPALWCLCLQPGKAPSAMLTAALRAARLEGQPHGNMALLATTFVRPVHDGNTVVPYEEWRRLKHFFHLNVKRDKPLSFRM